MSYCRHRQGLLLLLYLCAISCRIATVAAHAGEQGNATEVLLATIAAFSSTANSKITSIIKKAPSIAPGAAHASASRLVRGRYCRWSTIEPRDLPILATVWAQESSQSAKQADSWTEPVPESRSSSGNRPRCRPTQPAPLRLAVSKPLKRLPSNGDHNVRGIYPLSTMTQVPTNVGSKKVVSPQNSGQGQHQRTAGTRSNSGTTQWETQMSRVGCGADGGGMRPSYTWIDTVNSTMDEVKSLIVQKQGGNTNEVIAVASGEQVRGRGTKGRVWTGLAGNMFLTVAIPLERVPLPLSLVPLRVGTLIAPELQRRLQNFNQASVFSQEAISSAAFTAAAPQRGTSDDQPRVSLKWPNDILLNGGKVAGVLIEAELPFLLIGVGINVLHKPNVPQQGVDRGRQASCLAEYGAAITDETSRELSAALTQTICGWASGKDSAASVLSDWSARVDWDLPLEIRDERRTVKPLGVATDGRLRVLDPETGREELLATEYLL